MGKGQYFSPIYSTDTILSVYLPRYNIAAFEFGLNSLNICYVYGYLEILNHTHVEVNANYCLQIENSGRLELNGGDNLSVSGSQLEIKGLDGLPGVLRLLPGCQISGYKPDPDPDDDILHGDRIITDDFGDIWGDPSNPLRTLSYISVSSSNPNGLRWEGLNINSIYEISESDNKFILRNSQISGIDHFYVKHPNFPQYLNNEYRNCTYGVYFDLSYGQASPQIAGISSCSFSKNYCGIFVFQPLIQTPTMHPQYLSIGVKDCIFGGETNADINNFGICLFNCAEAKVGGSSFLSNVYGIYAQDSSILVGGSFIGDVPGAGEMEPNTFYFNEKAAIWLYRGSAKSLIFNNTFTETDDPHDRLSGIGIYSSDAELNVMDNNISLLKGHGYLGKKTYRTINPPTSPIFHGFSDNIFWDNGGCEVIGDAVSLGALEITSEYSQSTLPNRLIKSYPGNYPSVPGSLEDFPQWNHYLMANLSPDETACVAGNLFSPDWDDDPTRFYPDVANFDFVGDGNTPPGSLWDLITHGVAFFYQGDFTSATDYMKQVVETYPDSVATALAVEYLYLIEKADDGDFQDLREYLDLKISSDDLAPYITKEEITTECYIKEEDFPSAIQRLQYILDNPLTLADSLFALIDQAYCVFQASTGGVKNLPACYAKTTNLRSYLEFLNSLETEGFLPPNNDCPNGQLMIHSNYPNPFNPQTTIRYGLPDKGNVVISVYNLRGQLVRKLLNEYQEAGNHSVVWNGYDLHGRGVASGIYFVMIGQNGKESIHRMMLIK